MAPWAGVEDWAPSSSGNTLGEQGGHERRGRSQPQWPRVRFNEVVAASPSVAAAALCLVTRLIPWSDTSGPLLDLARLEPCVRPGVGGPRSRERTAPGRTPLQPLRAPGAGGAAAGLGDRAGRQVAGRRRAGLPRRRESGESRGPAAGRLALAVTFRRAARGSRRLATCGRPREPTGGGAWGWAAVARPRRFRFHAGCWLLFNVPTHVSVCLVNRSGRESQAAVLSPLGKANILPAQHMV